MVRDWQNKFSDTVGIVRVAVVAESLKGEDAISKEDETLRVVSNAQLIER